MSRKVLLKIVGGIKVVVPDSLNLITPYVICEQGDWFEDEIKFVRHVLQPGQRTIDIGANYGLFALSMAQSVGETGRVWAFEPASSTASYLAESVVANGFNQIVIDQRGLSSDEGTVRLSLNDNAELNEILRDDAPPCNAETIQITSLDLLQQEHDWSPIDFVKIDAEGEEARIIAGGATFFAQNSPLVQYEVKADDALHFELVEAFKEIGYTSYRLIPGLNLLAPFSSDEPTDSYLLNLFCCKADRADQLAARGLLVRPEEMTGKHADKIGGALLSRWNSDGRHNWEKALSGLPYAQNLLAGWQKSVDQIRSHALEESLALYAVSQRQDIPAIDRFIALRESFNTLQRLCTAEPQSLRFASLARVAREYGAREVAVRALHTLANDLFKARQVDANEPFLAVSARFDHISPGGALGNWIMGSVQETYEINACYSSFYAGSSGHERLKWIINLGFASDEIKRRLSLVEQRFSLPSAPA